MGIVANPSISAVADLLDRAGLPAPPASPQIRNHFWGYEDDGCLVGVIGLERFGETGLLRSLAIDADCSSRGIGRILVHHVEAEARRAGIATLFLFTDTAKDYFLRLDYRIIDRSQAPEEIRHCSQGEFECPASAPCMCKRLS